MKIGVRVHDFGKSTAEELAKKAKAVGFDAVQLVLNKAIEGETGLAGTLSKEKANYFYEVFKKEESVVWVCRNCGHVHVGKMAPKMCPTCDHPEAYFEMKNSNY